MDAQDAALSQLLRVEGDIAPAWASVDGAWMVRGWLELTEGGRLFRLAAGAAVSKGGDCAGKCAPPAGLLLAPAKLTS